MAAWWDKVNQDPEVIRQRSSEPPTGVTKMPTDSYVQYDLNDRERPIMISVNSWMSLKEAHRVYEEIGCAVNAVEAHRARVKD
jgi:hypothetical protein